MDHAVVQFIMHEEVSFQGFQKLRKHSVMPVKQGRGRTPRLLMTFTFEIIIWT